MKDLNPVITAYLDAGNARDAEGFIACFNHDAVVIDENNSHRGGEEILKWFHHTRDEYDFYATPKRFHEEDGETILVCEVKGNFPGSPVDLSYRFKLENGKIARLTIA